MLKRMEQPCLYLKTAPSHSSPRIMGNNSKNHIIPTAGLDEHTSPRWKVMYYIHKSLNGRRDAKKNRVAGIFVEGESPWQFQADFVEQRAEQLCRRITRDCPLDLLYYGRPLGLVSCVQADLPAYEYWGKHGFCEYCWVERDGTNDGNGATTEMQPPAQDAAGRLHSTSHLCQHPSTQALPAFARSSVTASDSTEISNTMAAADQHANVVPTTRYASMLSDHHSMRAVGAVPHGWSSPPNVAGQDQSSAASIRPDEALVDRRLAALRSSRSYDHATPRAFLWAVNLDLGHEGDGNIIPRTGFVWWIWRLAENRITHSAVDYLHNTALSAVQFASLIAYCKNSSYPKKSCDSHVTELMRHKSSLDLCMLWKTSPFKAWWEAHRTWKVSPPQPRTSTPGMDRPMICHDDARIGSIYASDLIGVTVDSPASLHFHRFQRIALLRIDGPRLVANTLYQPQHLPIKSSLTVKPRHHTNKCTPTSKNAA
ncbi:uncharacterized protein MYCFIDRAFT_170988 [Pseudocercospora fijiensis CIRAD86]|uniref:Uncharacterized protein n=1 Tax=Pseudocercospora fijiensis (strain CIRAD86) TaxID=383855 RepID=N1QBM0_PSEFD|nr:uncharacterized protein MYCFIDRAFT_170988 [Pseudocercospora fijiensis CIRAD86]EME89546.1 hypothetical protein MYCFIDRAFT_170988 [Pseudocercospora fijiensis CIRAD86]